MMSPRGPRKLDQPEAFQLTVECGRFNVIVEEVAARPGYVVMRRWIPGTPKGTWKRKAIGAMVLRDTRGAVLETAKSAARDAATRWYVEVTGEEATAERAVAVDLPFTVGETWGLISDVTTGKYPHKSQFRDELHAALRYAESVWGTDTAWSAIDSNQWTVLIRRRVGELVARGKTGIRATEITVSRIMTAVIWLRQKKRILPNAAHPDPTWRDDLLKFWKGLTKQKHDPEPHQPRYNVEQSRKLIDAAWHVDPRSGLLLALGAELRLGQVRRAKRSDLDLEAGEFGRFTVRGAGDKRGTVVDLTRGQRAAVDQALSGYLRVFEADYLAGPPDEDYLLFPGGKLFDRKSGKPYIRGSDPDCREPLSRSAITRRWELIEFMVGITHVRGRGAYGLRRAGVDAALDQNISEHGLKEFGGWSTPDMPRRVYADRENKTGRADASKARATFRGEAE
jgi:integrase